MASSQVSGSGRSDPKLSSKVVPSDSPPFDILSSDEHRTDEPFFKFRRSHPTKETTFNRMPSKDDLESKDPDSDYFESKLSELRTARSKHEVASTVDPPSESALRWRGRSRGESVETKTDGSFDFGAASSSTDSLESAIGLPPKRLPALMSPSDVKVQVLHDEYRHSVDGEDQDALPPSYGSSHFAPSVPCTDAHLENPSYNASLPPRWSRPVDDENDTPSYGSTHPAPSPPSFAHDVQQPQNLMPLSLNSEVNAGCTQTLANQGCGQVRNEQPRHRFAILVSLYGPSFVIQKNLEELVASLLRTTSQSSCSLQLILGTSPSMDLDTNRLASVLRRYVEPSEDQHGETLDTPQVNEFDQEDHQKERLSITFIEKAEGEGIDSFVRSVGLDDVDFLIMIKDDVRFLSSGWVEDVSDTFNDIYESSGEPFGFGCVSLLDESFTGFPSMPIIHKSLLERLPNGTAIFPSLDPSENPNDIGPLVFEAFFRFKCARIAPNSRVTRHPQRRTQKEAFARSKFITKHLPKVLSAISPLSRRGKPFGSIDVVTPSFRATKDVIERILKLPEPEDCVVKFTVVCDNPDSKDAVDVFESIARDHMSDCRVKIRINPVNAGPGKTRNHGLAESCADYVVFLDDDVLVEQNILSEYWTLAKQYPLAPGFIGCTLLPPPQTPRQFAVKFAGIACFWGIAKTTDRDLPWGITANLMVKREPEMFFNGPEVFCRGGGGEDVDFCMRLDRILKERTSGPVRSFIPAPKAIVHHPYWNQGACHLKQFFGWTKGDSALGEIHPQHSFLSFPDFSESMILLSLVLGVLVFAYHFIPIATALVFLAGYAMAEWMYEALCHVDLVKEWGLWFTVLVGLETCIVRSYSELGRYHGQILRRTLHKGFLRRFDWFQHNWPEYKQTERWRQFKRGSFRAAMAFMTLRLFHAYTG